MKIEDRIKQIEQRADKLTEPYDDYAGCPQCTHVMDFEFGSEKIGICHACAHDLNEHVPLLLSELKRAREQRDRLGRALLEQAERWGLYGNESKKALNEWEALEDKSCQ